MTRAGLDLVAIRSELFCRATGDYPRSVAQLVELDRARPRTGSVCVLDSDTTLDEWQRPVVLRRDADGGIDLRSVGPDGTIDTPDDIRQPRRGEAGSELMKLPASCDPDGSGDTVPLYDARGR